MLEDLEPDEWDKVTGISLKGAFLCVKACLGHKLQIRLVDDRLQLDFGGRIYDLDRTQAPKDAELRDDFSDGVYYAASINAFYTIEDAGARGQFIKIGSAINPSQVRSLTYLGAGLASAFDGRVILEKGSKGISTLILRADAFGKITLEPLKPQL